jgi:hypothetical protein
MPPHASSGTIYTAFTKRIVICPIQTTIVSPKETMILSDASMIHGKANWSFSIADLNGKMNAEKLQK